MVSAYRCQTMALHTVGWAENVAFWARGSDCLVSYLSHCGHSLNLFNESNWAASRGEWACMPHEDCVWSGARE